MYTEIWYTEQPISFYEWCKKEDYSPKNFDARHRYERYLDTIKRYLNLPSFRKYYGTWETKNEFIICLS